MNTITNTQNTINLYTQSSGQITNTQGESRVHHHKRQSQDSIEISQQGLQALGSQGGNNSTVNPLDSLVSDGTITQDQADAIQSAFQSAWQSNQASGTYNSKPTNPLDSLVSSGTITQDQEDAIKNAFKSARQAEQQQTNKVQEDSTDNPVNNVLDSMVSAGTITQDQEDAIESAFESAMKGI